ncbi:MAG: hypothetical protein ACI35R_01240 [Bacillus sp. (in: firmicutes)]
MKYKEQLKREQIDEVYMVMSFELFVYLDLFLLSFFLGFVLYTQLEHWLLPSIIASVFFIASSFVYKLFCTTKESY